MPTGSAQPSVPGRAHSVSFHAHTRTVKLSDYPASRLCECAENHAVAQMATKTGACTDLPQGSLRNQAMQNIFACTGGNESFLP